MDLGDLKEMQGGKDLRDHLDRLELQDVLVLGDSKVNLVALERMGHKERKAYEEAQAFQVLMVNKAEQDDLDLLVDQVQLEIKVMFKLIRFKE